MRVRPLRTRKGYALLFLLLARDSRPVDREELAQELWPDSDAPERASSLRRALTDLRNALGNAADRLTGDDRRTLRWDPTPGDWCDVVAFDRAVRRWERHGDRAAAREAAALAAQPLLAGIAEDIFPGERAARQERLLALLDDLARTTLADDPDEALRHARHACRLDPLRDTAQRRLYEALAATGDQPGALRAYRDYRIALQKEGGLSPDPETIACIARLRGRPTATTSGIPAFLGAFLGRERERNQLTAALQDGARLVTLTGPGGVGKTRVAAVVGATFGAVWVDLTALPRHGAPDILWRTVGSALGLPPGDPRPIRAAAAALPGTPRLLILDNAEHVASAAAAVAAALLTDSPQLQIVSTSRAPLDVAGETVFPILPLSIETAGVLFVQRAHAAGARIAPNAPEIATLCRLLDGLPLALEFAAARARALPLPRIIDALERRRTLCGTGGTANPRHRSLEETLAWSYDLLTPSERRLFAMLGLFAGSWSLDAAEEVAGGPCADALARLVDHSLALRQGDRYRLLETTRAFARDRLEECAQAESARTRLVTWAQTLARRLENGIWSSQSRAWQERYEADAANLREAIDSASGADARAIAARLGQVWWRKRGWREGLSFLEAALARPGGDGTPDDAEARWLAALFAWRLGLSRNPEAALSTALAAWDQSASDETLVYILHSAGTCRIEWGDLPGAATAFHAALARSQTTGDPFLRAYALNGIAASERLAGRTDNAIAAAHDAITLFRQQGNAVLEADSRNQRALALLGGGALDGARQEFDAARTLARASGAGDVAVEARIGLARVALGQGRLREAQRRFAAIERQGRTHGEPHVIVQAIAGQLRCALAGGAALDVSTALADIPHPGMALPGLEALDALGATRGQTPEEGLRATAAALLADAHAGVPILERLLTLWEYARHDLAASGRP